MVTKKDVDVLTLCDFKGLKRDTTQDDLHKRETVEIVKYFHEKCRDSPLPVFGSIATNKSISLSDSSDE